MPNITHSALVPYSIEQMFTLVNNINAYPEFIPGCTASRILEQNSKELTAKINISQSGISKSFTTRNLIINNQSIIMCLVEGPFTSFTGNWYFIPLNQKTSRLELHLDFEFKNKLIEIVCNCILEEITHNMVMAFTYRAKEIYYNA